MKDATTESLPRNSKVFSPLLLEMAIILSIEVNYKPMKVAV